MRQRKVRPELPLKELARKMLLLWTKPPRLQHPPRKNRLKSLHRKKLALHLQLTMNRAATPLRPFCRVGVQVLSGHGIDAYYEACAAPGRRKPLGIRNICFLQEACMADITVTEHLLLHQKRTPQATGQFTGLLYDLILSGKSISPPH